MTTINVHDHSGDCTIYGLDTGGYYVNARNGSTGHEGSVLYVGQFYEAPGTYGVRRAVLKFDTSSIPDDATIDSVTMSLACYSDDSGANFDIQIVKLDWSAYDPIGAANREAAYDACLAGTADDNIWRNTNGMSTNTYYESGALDTTWVSKTGYTYYGLRSKEDKDNSAPTGWEMVTLYASEDATYYPKLNVTYTAASSGVVTRLTLMGVGR